MKIILALVLSTLTMSAWAQICKIGPCGDDPIAIKELASSKVLISTDTPGHFDRPSARAALVAASGKVADTGQTYQDCNGNYLPLANNSATICVEAAISATLVAVEEPVVADSPDPVIVPIVIAPALPKL